MAIVAIEVDITVTRTFKEVLLELCLDYDNAIGNYPENEYEGQALYEFLLFKRGEHLDYSSRMERREKYDEYLKRREKTTKENVESYQENFEVYLERELESEVEE